MKRSMLKKVLAFGLAAAMTASCFAVTAFAVDEGLEITVQNASEPNTIDPNEVNANDCMALVLHMYEGLTRYRQDLAGVELAQAESVDVSEDGLTWTWHLRDDILWSDGQPVTAGDFVYSWQRLVSGSYDNSNFIDMVVNAVEIRSGEKEASELGVEAVDDKTTGLLVKVRDSNSLYQAMKQMLETSAAKRKEMGLAARQKIINEFEKSKVVNETIQQIQKGGSL